VSQQLKIKKRIIDKSDFLLWSKLIDTINVVNNL